MSLKRWIPSFSINDIIRLLIGLGVVVFFLFHEAEWYQFRFLQQLELFAYDARIRLFLPTTQDKRVVILDIDEKSLNAEGRFPWPRNKLARMVQQLFERYQVKVVGFDIAFPEEDTSSGLPIFESLAKGDLKGNAEYLQFLDRTRASLDYDRLFAEQMNKYPVVLGFLLGGKEDKAGILPKPVFDADKLGKTEFHYFNATGYSGNAPILQAAATAAGHLYPALDVDGTTRRVPIFMRYGNGFYETLSLAILRTAMGNLPATIQVDTQKSGNVMQGWIRAIQVGEVTIPLDSEMAALVPYRATGGFRYVSATDVIRGTLPENDLKDKIIVVGTSAQGLVDLRATPIKEDLAGVEIHASLVSGFLDQSIKFRPPEVLAISVLTILLIGIPVALFLPRLSALMSTAVIVVLFAAIFGANLYVWQAKNYVLPLASSLTMLVTLYFINMAYGFFTEARSRRLITGLFGTYVPKELVEEMSKNPGEYSMRGESRDMTVLFSDVRDFTSISEGLTPESLKDMMNAYLTAMTEVVQEKRGTIDKYIGDAIMAFWGAPLTDPEHATHALESALAMQRKIRELDAEFVKKGWPKLNIGVGLNCGVMSVGDMGSRFRRAYTVMGDSVNLASRLESLTKEYGVKILVSGNIVDTVQNYAYREVDKVRVKGKLEGVAIYEPVGKHGEIGDEVLKEIERMTKALQYYRQQRWDDAERHLKTLNYAAPDVKLYKIYLERIKYFRANPPPANWDGVFVFTTK